MPLTISSSFDAGNIRVVRQDGDTADLEIVKDHLSDFYQWFYFRVAGGADKEVTLRITNCAGSVRGKYVSPIIGYKTRLNIKIPVIPKTVAVGRSNATFRTPSYRSSI